MDKELDKTKLDKTKGEKQEDSKSKGHEINENDPLNQIIDRMAYLTLLLGSLFCSSKHKSQAHLSVTSVCTVI